MQDKNSEIIDIGCGTGLSGQEITLKGFSNIDGSDFLNKYNFKLEKSYDAIIAAGVISPNHAKPECLKNCLNHLKPNGIIIFSLNDHAYADKIFMKKINKIIQTYKLKILEKEYGEHLKKINLKSWIYVLKR